MQAGRGCMGVRKHRAAKKDQRRKSQMSRIKNIRFHVEHGSARTPRQHPMAGSIRALFDAAR